MPHLSNLSNLSDLSDLYEGSDLSDLFALYGSRSLHPRRPSLALVCVYIRFPCIDLENNIPTSLRTLDEYIYLPTMIIS